MRTFQSPRRRFGAVPSAWAAANATEAKARARAAAAERRAELHAGLPDVYRGPSPGSVWCEVTVTRGRGGPVLLREVLYVPLGRHRCDQFAEERDGMQQPALTNATAVGKRVAAAIGTPPSLSTLADIQRETEYAPLEAWTED